jgi:hypothetical protein
MKLRVAARTTRAGFTVLEVAIAIGILTIIAINMSMLLNATAKGHGASREQEILESHARQTLDRIVLALQSAARDSVIPAAEPPLYSSAVDYEANLGVQDGRIVFGPPERIGLELATGEVLWFRDANTPAERRVVWGRYVNPTMQGEVPANGLDDNGNGIIDELGLSFTVDGDTVLVRMTLARANAAGNQIVLPVEQRIAFRN